MPHTGAIQLQTPRDAKAAIGHFARREGVRRTLRNRGWGIVAFMSVMVAALLVFRRWFPDAIEWFNEACSIIGPLIGAFWCMPRRGRDKAAEVWSTSGARSCLAFAVGILCFSGGELVLARYLLTTQTAPTPSPADALFVAAYPFFIVGILLLPARAHSGLARTRVLIDSLLTIIAAAAVSGFFLLVPMLTPIDQPLVEKLLTAAYPLLDLVLLFCLLLHSARTALPWRSLLPISAGLLIIVLSDTVYGWQVLHETYFNGNLIDLGWPLGYMLIGLGASALRMLPQCSEEECSTAALLRRAGRSLQISWAALPYASIVIVGALSAYAACETPDDAGFLHARRTELYTACIILGALILVRQLLVILENKALNGRLRAALVDLEAGHRSLASAHETFGLSEERFRIAARSVGDLIYEWDIGQETIQWFGDVDALLGYGPSKFPRTFKAWQDAIIPADRAIVADRLQRHLETGEPFILEYRIARADGAIMIWSDRGSVIRDSDAKPLRMIGGISDVTERRLSEYKFRHASLHDALTGLPNRQLFNDRVDRCVQRARRAQDYGYAVLFLDLDRFKIVNDSLGHAAGDTLLKAVSERLNSCLRGIDTVSRLENPVDGTVEKSEGLARLGGDEFTILLDDLANPQDAVLVADRILAALAQPLKFDGHEISSTASIGIAIGSAAYETASDVLRDADAAMYHAKAAGRGRYVLFDASMREAAIERLQVESDLRRATEHRDFCLHYQPIIDLQTRQLVGFEALIRWNRNGKVMNPADFIPIAEETGLILPIGAWVMAEASRQLRQWRQEDPEGFAGVSVSINLSRRQLKDPLLITHVGNAQHGLAAGDLKLEITESLIMADDAFAVMQQIRGMGTTLSMDDFGTGYSSLSCLHRFPIQELKIDRAFIAQLSNGREYAAVVQAIVALAHNLNIRVVAEGLETPEQVALLQALDCDLGQGYFFARPMTGPEAVTFVKNHASSRRVCA